MIHWKQPTDDLFASNAEALVNTVNCVGVMGKGIALSFKQRFPQMFQEYRSDCRLGKVRTGTVHVWKSPDESSSTRYVFNFPTKDDWRNPSKMEYIQTGLISLRSAVIETGVKSIAIPALGCTNGGLGNQWSEIKSMIMDQMIGLDADVMIYPPRG